MTTATPATAHTASRACYLRGCPDPGCRNKHLRYCKQYNVETAHNGPRTTPAAPYIPRVQALIADGWSHQAIADSVGVSRSTINDLSAGYDRHLLVTTARLLDRGLPSGAPRNWWVDSTGTMRRLQALTVIGWPQQAIAVELGLGYTTIRHIINGHRRHTPRPTVNAVNALYGDWSRHPGPSQLAARRARARGWRGVDFWDDVDRIDDPGYDPDATLSRAEQIAEDGHWLLATGLHRDLIAARLGVSRFYLDRSLREHPAAGQVAA